MKSGEIDNTPIFASFNQDGSFFNISTKQGFCIFSSCPYEFKTRRLIENSFSIVEMLGKSNIIALVGDGKNRDYPQNKLLLWDDNSQKIVAAILVKYTIKTIKLKNSKIFIIGEREIRVFNFGSFKNVDIIHTFPNKNGIFATCSDTQSYIIAYPSNEMGKIAIKDYHNKDENSSSLFKTLLIQAHQSEVSALSMNYDGSLIASAGEKGNIIRIFETEKGEMIQEFRRGTDSADIYSLAFDPNSFYIACSSSKGTVHIFSMKKKDENDTNKNKKSKLDTVKNFFGAGHLGSEKSFAQFKLPSKKDKIIVTFCPDYEESGGDAGDKIRFLVLTYGGKFFRANFLPLIGGECQLEEEVDIFKK